MISLRVLSVSKGARFLDLEESYQFTDSDFGDTVHLNTAGGIRMVQLIVASVLQNEEFGTLNKSVSQTSFNKQSGEAL